MTKDDEIFISDIKFFWTEKGDIERYASYDSDRLKELDPLLWTAWQNYKLAIETLNNLTR